MADPDLSEAPAASTEAETTGKRNAFAELMTPKNKKQKQQKQAVTSDVTKNKNVGFTNNRKDALGAYIARPESYPQSVVVYYNDDFVAIHDLYPKSSLHLLLLPRDSNKFFKHPFDAFEDAEFLHKVRCEVRKLRTLAARELRRRYGKYSAQDRVRLEALSTEPPVEELPPGRDWEKEIMAGIHAHPSMNHLHIHVMSVDRFSERLKHRKHYNSFSTPFFVDIEDFPLAQDDKRRHPGKEGYLKQDFKCWRCMRNFGNKFQDLKRHLEEEYDEWKKI